MSVPPTPSRRHTPWPRALLTLLTVLLVTLAPACTPATAAPPPAALSTETGGSEIQHDLTDAALRLRLPTRRATHIPTARPRTPAPPRPAARPAPAPPRLLPHVPTPRSVVLRC
ncbi:MULTISPECIES: hypothetical protein [Streptomyces]|uniref:Secreted protein n=2 Tax=Streptomyces TaxID=1883 RepID=A0A5P2BEI8_STRVZ|nr:MULTISPECIES: hypothetical protein [Streptomyces]NDZ87844.1 hypothetical protein [Streptomyces sp. SID10115]NEB48624.1 hypothetical protein [Streptomyces sp. SID339]QES28138.1 hypothetical protein DEJ47_18425 [Streptomyces venezuelae]